MENEQADQVAKKGAAMKSNPTKQPELQKQINNIKQIHTPIDAACETV